MGDATSGGGLESQPPLTSSARVTVLPTRRKPSSPHQQPD